MLKIIKGRNASHQLLLARNRTALTEVKNIVCGSKIRWRWRSYTASVPSDVPKPGRGYKRVPKDERRAIVESFVNKYRATHDGKFPSPSEAQKHVGGSYYVIRTMIQELEFKSKMATSDRGTENLLEVGLIEESKLNVDVEGEYDTNTIIANDVEIDDASDNHLDALKESVVSDVAERTLFEEVATPMSSGGQSNTVGGKKEEAESVPSNFVATESHSLGETVKVFHPHINNIDERKEEILSENLPDSGGINCEDGKCTGSSESEKNAISSSQPNEAELPKKSSLWGNLKSFADGFLKMWRKM